MTYLLSALRLVAVATILLLFASPAWAEGEAILLLVHGDELPKEKLRDAIASELGKPVTLEASAGAAGGIVTVTYRARAKELAVTWDGPKKGTVSRVVSASGSSDTVVRDAALLAGNLARDEADDLLAPPPPPLPSLPVAPTPPAPAPVTPNIDRPAPKPRDPDDRDFNLGVIYPLATNFGRPHVKTKFDWNLISSRIGELSGMQIGGVNVVSHDASGLQIAWALNVVGGTASGWQFAPLMNKAGAVEGLQTAPLNVAGDLDGVQLGFVNVAGKVRGATVGLLNVAEHIDGVPIGIASITSDGGVHPRVWSSNATFANLGLKLATRHTYTMPTGHYHRAYDRDFFGAGFTIGGHFPFAANESGPYLDTELALGWLYAPERSTRAATATRAQSSYHQHLVQPRLRAIFGWRFAEHFSIFAGAGLLTQVRLLDEADRALIRIGPEFVAGVEL